MLFDTIHYKHNLSSKSYSIVRIGSTLSPNLKY